jgi:hypothetical protein
MLFRLSSRVRVVVVTVASASACVAQKPVTSAVPVSESVASPQEGIAVDCKRPDPPRQPFRIEIVIDSATAASRGTVLVRFAGRPSEPGMIYEAVSLRAQLSPTGQSVGVACGLWDRATVHGLARNVSQLFITTDAPDSVRVTIRKRGGPPMGDSLLARSTRIYRLVWPQ